MCTTVNHRSCSSNYWLVVRKVENKIVLFDRIVNIEALLCPHPFLTLVHLLISTVQFLDHTFHQELFGDDSEDEPGSQHSRSDIQSENSGNRSDASMHSEQEENDQSDAEQRSGSECDHQEEDGVNKSEGASPISGAGSHQSRRDSARSDRR